MSSEFWKHEVDFVPSGKALPNSDFLSLLPNGAKVLDIGCGSGNLSSFLSDKGFQVTGIDINSGLIESCRTRNLQNTEFFVHDLLLPLPFADGTFDAVVGSFVLVNVLPQSARIVLVSEITRVLKKFGCVWIHEGIVSAKYKQRYELCEPFTEQRFDFFSYKDKKTAGSLKNTADVKKAINAGEVERTIHHFPEEELVSLFGQFECLSWKLQSIHAPRKGNPLESVVAIFRSN